MKDLAAALLVAFTLAPATALAQSLVVVARVGDPLPGGAGNIEGVGSATLGPDGRVCFLARSGPEDHLVCGAPGALEVVLSTGEALPSGQTLFSGSIQRVAVGPDGDVILQAATAPGTAIVAVQDGAAVVLAETGGASPGGGVFDSLGTTPRINALGHVAFLDGGWFGEGAAVFVQRTGPLEAIWQAGDAMPRGGTLANLSGLALDDAGGVYFLGVSTDYQDDGTAATWGEQGLYVDRAEGGGFVPLLRNGDTVVTADGDLVVQSVGPSFSVGPTGDVYVPALLQGEGISSTPLLHLTAEDVQVVGELTAEGLTVDLQPKALPHWSVDDAGTAMGHGLLSGEGVTGMDDDAIVRLLFDVPIAVLREGFAAPGLPDTLIRSMPNRAASSDGTFAVQCGIDGGSAIFLAAPPDLAPVAVLRSGEPLAAGESDVMFMSIGADDAQGGATSVGPRGQLAGIADLSDGSSVVWRIGDAPPSGMDLAVEASVAPSMVVGAPFLSSLAVENVGEGAIRSAELRLEIHEGSLEDAGLDALCTTAESADGVLESVTCPLEPVLDLALLEAGQRLNVVMPLRAAANGPVSATLTGTAFDDEGSTAELGLGNNVVDLRTTVEGTIADLALEFADNAPRLTVTNHGPDDATDVRVDGDMGAVIFAYHDATSGCSFQTDTTDVSRPAGFVRLTCDLGTLAAGASVDVSWLADPLLGREDFGNRVTAEWSATVTSVAGDTDLENNSDTATFEVVLGPDEAGTGGCFGCSVSRRHDGFGSGLVLALVALLQLRGRRRGRGRTR